MGQTVRACRAAKSSTLPKSLAPVLVVLALLALIPAAPASPLKDPKRVLRGGTVDLTPLFHWWTNHAGARPLTAWVHVTGSIVGTNVQGWVVEAQVEHTDRPRTAEGGKDTGGGPNKIILHYPPLQDRAEFERLSAQLKQLNQERDQVASAEGRAKQDQQVNNRVQAAYRREGVRDRSLAAQNRQDKQIMDQAKAELKPLDQQIQALKTQLAAYPNPDHYVVDCFALDGGQTYQGLLLYDYGFVFH